MTLCGEQAGHGATRAELASVKRELVDARSNYETLRASCETAFRDRDYYSSQLLALREALLFLRNEVKGAWSLEEPSIRHAIGNTNYSCVRNALERADAALTATSDNAAAIVARQPGASQWEDIMTRPDTDDLMWFAHWGGGAWNIEGPKSSSYDDVDCFDIWAPCEPPPMPSPPALNAEQREGQ